MSARHTLAISPEVQAVLRESRIEADRVVLPPRQLDRKLYESVIKVLGEYGAKWNRSAKAIVFPSTARPKLEEALLAGTVKREKVIRQAFYTPDEVADRLVRFADGAFPSRSSYMTVLEPSAGRGALIRAVRRFYADLVALKVHAVEIDEAAASKLEADDVAHADFLRLTPDDTGTFHLCLLNPPYQRGQALKHVSHAMRFVQLGGVLGAIVPMNFPDSVNGVEFESEELGAGAFKESGTGINTKMIRAVLS